MSASVGAAVEQLAAIAIDREKANRATAIDWIRKETCMNITTGKITDNTHRKKESAVIAACVRNARNLSSATLLFWNKRGGPRGMGSNIQMDQTPAAERRRKATSESNPDFIYGDQASPLVMEMEKADEDHSAARVARNLH